MAISTLWRSTSSAAWLSVVVAALLAACAGPGSERASRSSSVGYGGLSALTGTPSVSQIVATQRLTPVAWSDVQGWSDDDLLGATSALHQTCSRLGSLPDWRRPCALASQLDELDATATRAFFEQNFTPYQLANRDGSVTGLVTGYYEPLLHGSMLRHAPYLYPLYRWPGGSRHESLPSRAELERSGVLTGSELVYVDDPIDAFFLQVQGSGRILMDDGTVMRVGFGGTNNQPYRSIGKWLLDNREITPAQATMQGIKAWARANPDRVTALLDTNPRFVFFKEMSLNNESAGVDGPIGALGVPLTPERSIAVDPTSIPLGMPVFLATTRPLSGTRLDRLVFAQDTGSAIKGGVRADFFWGLGDSAGDLAGKMKQAGRMWIVLPRS